MFCHDIWLFFCKFKSMMEVLFAEAITVFLDEVTLILAEFEALVAGINCEEDGCTDITVVKKSLEVSLVHNFPA